MVSVKLQAASSRPLAIAKNLPSTLEFPGKTLETITIGEIKQAIAKQCPQFYTDRQRITASAPVKTTDKNAKVARPKALADKTTLQEAGLDASSNTLYVKDLGTQVSYRTVFIVEYIGPLLIHPVVYHLPKLIYGKDVQHSQLQTVAYTLVMLHFLKRELETIFVHRFSHATMPVGNLFRNSAHYHLLSGLLLSLALYGPWYSQGSLSAKHTSAAPSVLLGWGWPSNDTASLLKWIIIWTFAELSNFHAHLTLRNLRPANNPTARGIPRGYLFEYVSCPNYTFEILAWIAFTFMTKSWASLIFIIAGTTPMVIWAIKKHKAYRREFGSEYPRNRKIIVPFLF
ncbi:3-oxo-5-alpha-steroid 4-dehydrogenase [Rhizoctonia solani]|uniref:3-oxo-5-alpha-steroid 4-dehydrogenase n=1 Tax=Rhizoctonia solani TaxID=456999 RepID=A0A8H7LHP3_9AGAM|nr:3-oxo-5-alpha-steroid 4-dehydrogenase [Rhizoctonia solani]KAF8676904.1 3-oxo-5-alpha-steroid 4-dehydrogenase [Rhizoctonia solani]QRW18446.1 3-oxo-5-alpha-steroid 4-dehydrogenase [Rhizoctonia solani]